MKYVRHLIACYPVSCLYIAFIWILCFGHVPQTPLENVSFIDKWVHVAMYAGTCTTIWYEYLRKHERINRSRVFVFAWLLPIVMSGVIEILQATCTGGQRSGEWLDFAANSVGVTVGAIIGIALVWYRARGNKDC
ncbi:MAG: VanZ family protein [Prevotella sp.]